MPPLFKVLIVDDEQAARDKLKIFLASEKDFEVVAMAKNGMQALEYVEQYQPDLMFLDIQMPKLDGLSVATNLEDNPNLRIVFVTGFNEYAVNAFDINAVDYLLKPYDKGRFQKTLKRIRNQSSKGSQYSIPKLVKDYRSEQPFPEQLLFKTENALEVVKVDDIEWIESSGNYVKVCLFDNAFIARQTLISVHSQLDPKRFIRIHRSHLVNIAVISQAHALSKGDYSLTLVSGTELRLSRNYKEQFFEYFNNH